MRVDILTQSLTAASSQEQKPGWEQQKERIQNELEWCARDIARREKIVREVREHVSMRRTLLTEMLIETSVSD